MSEHQKELEQIFNFSIDEIYANKQGYLTQRQQDFLDKYRKSTSWGWFIAILLMIISIAVVVFFTIGSSNLEDPGIKQALPSWGIAGGLFLGIFLFFSLLGVYRNRDIRTGRISLTEGRATKEDEEIKHHSRSLGHSYIVEINKVKFIIPEKKKYDAIRTGNYYRVFFIKTSHVHIILSLEAL